MQAVLRGDTEFLGKSVGKQAPHKPPASSNDAIMEGIKTGKYKWPEDEDDVIRGEGFVLVKEKK